MTARAMHVSLGIIFAAMAALSGCSRASVITIANRSSLTLTNVVVSGSGFTQRIDRMAAGSQRSLAVHPSGESGVRLAFDVGGRHIDAGERGYFEAGGSFDVTVVVEPDLEVSVSSKLRNY